MNTEKYIQHMLQAIIEKIQIIVNDRSKQSFGSLEYLLNHMIDYRNRKQYLQTSGILTHPVG